MEEIKDTAMRVNKMIDDVEREIKEAERSGLNISEAKNYFRDALSSFEKENYEEAEVLLNRASDVVDEIRSKITLENITKNVFSSLTEYLKVNWQGVLGFLIFMVFAFCLYSPDIRIVSSSFSRGTLARISGLVPISSLSLLNAAMEFFSLVFWLSIIDSRISNGSLA